MATSGWPGIPPQGQSRENPWAESPSMGAAIPPIQLPDYLCKCGGKTNPNFSMCLQGPYKGVLGWLKFDQRVQETEKLEPLQKSDNRLQQTIDSPQY